MTYRPAYFGQMANKRSRAMVTFGTAAGDTLAGPALLPKNAPAESPKYCYLGGRIVMRSHWVEHRTLHGNTILSWDIAHHFYTRHQRTAVVVTDVPNVLYPAVRKQWLKVIRQVQRERSSTLDATKIHELTNDISRMLGLCMTTKSPYEVPSSDIGMRFADVSGLLAEPPICHTLYVTVSLPPEVLEEISRYMPEGSLIVQY
ncbi:hypothetical protein ACIRSS_50100 [Amycolatopsis sp. NPDC101161]|uniref:hypothetical protein n=1 Tax=Amycolatopsis sp. NPDC101161 TaxID=3363940 RepID=UPI00382CE067